MREETAALLYEEAEAEAQRDLETWTKDHRKGLLRPILEFPSPESFLSLTVDPQGGHHASQGSVWVPARRGKGWLFLTGCSNRSINSPCVRSKFHRVICQFCSKVRGRANQAQRPLTPSAFGLITQVHPSLRFSRRSGASAQPWARETFIGAPPGALG